MSDEVVIRELENPKENLRRVSSIKDPGARWVPGLTPVDEDGVRAEELAAILREKQRRMAEEQKVSQRHWLLGPILAGIVFLVFLGARLMALRDLTPLEFAAEEVPTWPFIRDLTILDYFNVVAYPATCALFVGWICLQFATITEQFPLFLGVGCCFLSTLAAIGEVVILDMACPANLLDDKGRPTECFLPITLLSLCARMSRGAPSLGLTSIHVVLDNLLPNAVKDPQPKYYAESASAVKDHTKKRQSRRFPFWLVVTALPVVTMLLDVLTHYWYRQPSLSLVGLFPVVQGLTTVLVLRRLYKQPRFAVHWEDQKEKQA